MDLRRRALSAGVSRGVSIEMGCLEVPLMERVTAGEPIDMVKLELNDMPVVERGERLEGEVKNWRESGGRELHVRVAGSLKKSDCIYVKRGLVRVLSP